MLEIRDQKFDPPLLLAPMAGLTHSALRTLLCECGGVGLLYTEMLSARRLPVENPKVSPWLIRTGQENPLCYQLFITRPEEAGPALEALHRFGADGVDINLGCPAPRVRQAGGGSSLMAAPDRVRALVREVRRHTELVLSAKIRLGETLDERGLRDFCLMLAGEGIDYLTVHARLRGEQFCRKPRWEWIGRVKEWLDIPVIANGGIFSVEDARACLELSGADGLMIGRAAPQKPWLFAELAREIYGLDLPRPAMTLPAMYSHFATALLERFRPERRLGRLKEFTHYFALNYSFGHLLATSVQASTSFAEAISRAEQFFRQNDPRGMEEMGERLVSPELLSEAAD